jgi:CubicO group peptidase (beta-lactamase class C family)
MIRFHNTLAVAALLLVGLRPAVGLEDALQRCLAARAEQDNFSGVIAATRNGETIALLARGKLAGDESAAITAETRFNLASASKMLTAVAVGQLIDAGKVRLDDPIGTFVTGLEPETAAVTMRQLLTHTSGLGDFFRPQNLTAMMRARTATDLLPLVAQEKPAFTSGSRFAYSNSGFVLLGVAIERVSGVSYGDYLARHVFAPARMTSTGLDPKPLATLAIGMTTLGPGGTLALHPAPGATEGYGSPAGGLFSTVVDLQRFARALLDHRLTSAAITAALTEPQVVSAPATQSQPERQYGFGFGVGVDDGHKWFGHNGGTLGANAEFQVFPEDRLTLSVLSNRDPPMASAMFAYLKKLVLAPSVRATCGQG